MAEAGRGAQFVWPEPLRETWRIVTLYVVLAGLWIVASDRFLGWLTADPHTLETLQTVKGFLFIAVTATALFVLIHRALRSILAVTVQLARSEEQLRLLVEGVRDYALFLLTPAGDIATWNPGAERIKGYPAAEAIGRPVGIFYTAEDAAAGLPDQILRNAAREGQCRYEGWRVRKDGSHFWAECLTSALYDEHGALRGFAKITRDATERHRAELALRESERYNRTLFDQSPVGLALADMDGRLVDVNPAFARIIGRTVDETLGLTYWDITPEHYRPQEQLQLDSLRETGCYGPYEKEYRHRDGHLVPVRLQGLVIERHGAPFIWSAVEDITARKRAEAELHHHREHLEELVAARTAELEEKNAELEAFTYSVSHDLRAPLRAIAGFAGILERRHQGQLNEEARHYLGNILLAAERMGRLIDDLLAYARLGRRSFSSGAVSLERLLAALREECSGRLAESGAVLALADNLPTVQGDLTLLRQLFANLLGNALTYRHPGVPPRVTVTAETSAGLAVVRVIDNGIGIPPEHREKVFDLFQRLHAEELYPGTGIGLAIVRKAATLLGGKVWIEASSPAGTTFCVQLSLAAPQLCRKGGQPGGGSCTT